RMRNSRQRLPSDSERCQCLIAGDCRETLQEFVERGFFEIIEQRLDRHPRPDEHRRPTHNLRIAVHDFPWTHDSASLPCIIPRVLKGNFFRWTENSTRPRSRSLVRAITFVEKETRTI